MSRRSLIESLECRKLLAADLSVAFDSTTLPDALVVGAKSKAATATLLVSNSGDPVLKTTKGNLTATVGLRDSNGVVTSIGTANVKASALAKGTPAKAKVKLAPPATLAEGTYTLVASVAGGEVVPEDNTANNSIDNKTVSVEQANSDFTIVATTDLAGSVAAGAAGTVNISVTNSGNVASKATGVVEITSTIDGVTSVLTTVEKLKLNVKVGATINLKPISFKAQNSTEGNVQAVIGVNLTSTALGDDTTNNGSSPATLTVTPPPPSPLGTAGIGEKMTFVKTDGAGYQGTGFESGNWTDSNGRTGTYYITTGLASDGACQIHSGGVPIALLKFTFNNGKTKLGGTTITYGVDASIAAGTVQFAGNTYNFSVGK